MVNFERLTKAVRFAVESISSSGTWAVYSYQSRNKKLTSVTSFEILSADQSYKVQFNRDDLNVLGQTSGDWALLGKYEFNEGQPVEVIISNLGADAPMRADAVLFVKQ